jgi:hypothetical protein
LVCNDSDQCANHTVDTISYSKRNFKWKLIYRDSIRHKQQFCSLKGISEVSPGSRHSINWLLMSLEDLQQLHQLYFFSVWLILRVTIYSSHCYNKCVSQTQEGRFYKFCTPFIALSTVNRYPFDFQLPYH